MSARLSSSRPRTNSRPPLVSPKTASSGFPGGGRKSNQPVTLADLRDEDDDEWEPTTDEPDMTLEQVREGITQQENELRAKGKEISGRTM